MGSFKLSRKATAKCKEFAVFICLPFVPPGLAKLAVAEAAQAVALYPCPRPYTRTHTCFFNKFDALTAWVADGRWQPDDSDDGE